MWNPEIERCFKIHAANLNEKKERDKWLANEERAYRFT